MALSKKTKAEVDSGKTTIKESEDVIDNSKPDTGNSSNNSGSSGNSGNSGNSGLGENKPEHKHNWVAQYETVHHPEEGHNEQYVIKEAWTEQVPRY